MVKIGKFPFKSAMSAITAIGHARSSGTGTLAINRFMRCLQAFRREGKSQIIVRTQEQYAAIADFCLGRRINLFYRVCQKHQFPQAAGLFSLQQRHPAYLANSLFCGLYSVD